MFKTKLCTFIYEKKRNLVEGYVNPYPAKAKRWPIKIWLILIVRVSSENSENPWI